MSTAAMAKAHAATFFSLNDALKTLLVPIIVDEEAW
jgi:hypothetical protein